MRDVLFVALLVAFFVASTGFVRVCERLIGPDEGEPGADDAGAPTPDRAVAA